MPSLLAAAAHRARSNVHADKIEPTIGAYSFDTHVTGMHARFSTEFTIHIDNNREIEGELDFPMPEADTVNG